MVKKITIYGFMNSFTQGRSGADILLIKILKSVNFMNKVVVTSNNGKLLCEQLQLNAKYLILSKERKFNNVILIYIIRTVRVLFTKLQTTNNILLSSSDFFPDVIPCYFLKNKQNHWLQIIHHLYPNYQNRPGNIITNFFGYYLQKLSLILIKKRADLVITVNELTKKALINQGFAKNKVINVPNGVDIDFIDKTLKSNVQYEAVSAGRLHQTKGIFNLINIWKKVCNQLPFAKLAIIGVGDQPTINQLKLLIRKNHLQKNIDLINYLPDNRFYSIIKSAKVFVLPSSEEGFSLVIAEAMACQTPVVAWDLPELKYLYQNNLIFIPQGNNNLFSNTIVQLIINKPTKMIIQARQFINQFNWNKIKKQYLSIFNNYVCQ